MVSVEAGRQPSYLRQHPGRHKHPRVRLRTTRKCLEQPASHYLLVIPGPLIPWQGYLTREKPNANVKHQEHSTWRQQMWTVGHGWAWHPLWGVVPRAAPRPAGPWHRLVWLRCCAQAWLVHCLGTCESEGTHTHLHLALGPEPQPSAGF